MPLIMRKLIKVTFMLTTDFLLPLNVIDTALSKVTTILVQREFSKPGSEAKIENVLSQIMSIVPLTIMWTQGVVRSNAFDLCYIRGSENVTTSGAHAIHFELCCRWLKIKTTLIPSQCTPAGQVYTGMPLVDPVYTGITLGDPANTCRVHWNSTGKN